MKKYFGKLSMSWAKVIIFSVVTALYTAILNLIPLLKDTSFQDIAINPEAWILFAMFIIMNCTSRKEAVLKTFVFFLISQPLIYLVEALFGPVGFAVFQNYKYWFVITLLTIPGAAVAFQVKKKGWLGALSLSVAIAFLGYMAVKYFNSLRMYFPNHLLSMVFCIALAVFMIILFIDDTKIRLVASAIFAITIIIPLIVTKPVMTYELTLPEGDWNYTVENKSIVQIEKDPSGSFIIKAGEAGSTLVSFTNKNGELKEYYISVSGGGIYLNEFE